MDNKKFLLGILLVIVLIFGGLSRLSVLGWLTVVGFGTVLIFGFIHTLLNTIFIRNANQLKKKDFLFIIIFHILFLGLFLFQSDFDDSRGYIIIQHVLGINSKPGEENSAWTIFLICLILYFLFIGILFFRIKRIVPSFTSKKIRAYILVIMGTIILPPGFLFITSYLQERNEMINDEAKGKYENLQRALKSREKVKHLRLYKFPNSYTEIPKGVFKLTELEELEMYSNEIKDIPKEIALLKKLKQLDLQYNQITAVPDEIAQLTHLEEIVLMDNQIESINPKICECKQLKSLSVGGVSLNNIPDCISKMPSLEKLVVQSDSINHFMDEFKQFQNLKELNLFTYKNEVRDIKKYLELKKALPKTKIDIPSSIKITE